MSMDIIDTATVYTIKKKDGSLAARFTVECFDLDYEQLMNTTMVHMQSLASMADLGNAEKDRHKSK